MKGTKGFSDQKAPGPPAKRSTLGGSHSDDGDSVGVGSGLSARSDLGDHVVDVDGNLDRPVANPVETHASSKGKKFDIC